MTTNRDESGHAEIVTGEIPEAILDAARAHFNLSQNEIWGVYLTPYDPRNPLHGEHYLGKSKKTPEQMTGLFAKEAAALDKDNGLQSLRAGKLVELKSLSQLELAQLLESGSQIIECHERKHKDQWERTNYQTIIIEASKVMQTLERNKEETAESQKRAHSILNSNSLFSYI